MTDIVARLRENADLDAAEHVPAEVVQMQYEAADEINRLRAEVEVLRKELATSQESERSMSVYSVTLRKELAEANSFIESLAKACQAAEARAIEAEAAVLKGEA